MFAIKSAKLVHTENLSFTITAYFRAAILRVVFYTLKLNYPQKEFFNLRNHVYDFVDAHWGKICVGKISTSLCVSFPS